MTDHGSETTRVADPQPSALARYWRAYGGFGALGRSAYFRLALIVALLHWGTWTSVTNFSSPTPTGWWDTVLTVLPNILGFLAAGYAILTSYGSEGFRGALAGRKAGQTSDSPFVMVNASFVHACLVATAALVVALTARAFAQLPGDALARRSLETIKTVFGSWLGWACWFVGYFLFIYALALTAATVINVFQLGLWFDSHRTNERARGPRNEQSTGKGPTQARLVGTSPANSTGDTPAPPARVGVASVAPTQVDDRTQDDDDEDPTTSSGSSDRRSEE